MTDQGGLIKLPRGGSYVSTARGPVQVGVPPETIKDSLALGVPLSAVFVVPPALFDRRRGLVLAEIEFPAYYNFFVMKRRARLVVEDETTRDRLKTTMRESMFGSRAKTNHEEFAATVPLGARPDFARETDHFRRGPDGKCRDVDDLVEFVVMTPDGVAELGDGLRIERRGDEYAIYADDTLVTLAPRAVELPDRPSPSFAPLADFVSPDFGLTVLGASHGFDHRGKTTGFILWIGGRGILIDPPVDTTLHLRESGVMPKIIDGVILTHCHADHDSGVFAKLLEEGRIRLYTTPTILASFLRKYSALSGIAEIELRRTFSFCPVKIGQGTPINGADLIFFYTLHSIPTIGFEAFYGGRSLAFSSDTLYDPPAINKLCELGVINPERRDALIDFPWHHSLVFHEAGVPPLHTPISALAELPADVKERLLLVHIAKKDVPSDCGLRGAEVGLENTIRIEVERPAHAAAIDVLNVFCSVDFFRDLPMSRARELLMLASHRRASAGETIISQGTEGHEFYVIVSGTVMVERDGEYLKTYHAGEYFGEAALVLNQPRAANVVARSAAQLLTLDRHGFLYLLRGTDIPTRLVRLARAREARSWELFNQNSALRQLSSPQKTQLQTFMEHVEFRAGEHLFAMNEPAAYAFLIDRGEVRIDPSTERANPYVHGALFAAAEAMREGETHHQTATMLTDGAAFRIAAADLLKFLSNNPGVLLLLLGADITE